MTFLPRPRKDAEEHQFVCNPQGLICAFTPQGRRNRGSRGVFRGDASLWIYYRVILKLVGEISDGRLPGEPIRIA